MDVDGGVYRRFLILVLILGLFLRKKKGEGKEGEEEMGLEMEKREGRRGDGFKKRGIEEREMGGREMRKEGEGENWKVMMMILIISAILPFLALRICHDMP